MKALNFVGQLKIDEAKIQLIYNHKKADKLIRQAIITIRNNAINLAKSRILNAYELVCESCNLTFIAVEGLQALVLNEQADAENHIQLTKVSDSLFYSVTCTVITALWYLGKHNINESVINKIKEQLTEKQFSGVLKHIHQMPVWMANTFKQ